MDMAEMIAPAPGSGTSALREMEKQRKGKDAEQRAGQRCAIGSTCRVCLPPVSQQLASAASIHSFRLVHRVETETTGMCLIARTAEAAAVLADAKVGL